MSCQSCKLCGCTFRRDNHNSVELEQATSAGAVAFGFLTLGVGGHADEISEG